jgi:hypothetical protein
VLRCWVVELWKEGAYLDIFASILSKENKISARLAEDSASAIP